MMINEFFMAPTGTVQETLELYEEIHDKNMVSSSVDIPIHILIASYSRTQKKETFELS